MDGNKNTELSQIIFRTRGRTRAIKQTATSGVWWQYLCGFWWHTETKEEFLRCKGFGYENENLDVSYKVVFGKSIFAIYPLIMGNRHTNFKDLILSSRDILKRKFETTPSFPTPFSVIIDIHSCYCNIFQIMLMICYWKCNWM